MATWEEYKKSLKEGYNLDQMYANKEEATKRNNEAYNNSVDTAAQNSVAVYQDSIDRAPAQALEQKGTNAVQEEINRRQTAEAMANMGLTDSGLNRSQQTAISLSRGNADAAVDRQTQEYVNQLQMAIDSVLTEAETKKAANQAASEKELQDWWAEANNQLEISVNDAAAKMHAADIEAETDLKIEQLKLDANNQNNGITAFNEYVTSRVKDGVDPIYAKAEAHVLFGTGDKEAQTYYYTYNSAKQQGYTDAEAHQIATLTAPDSNPEAVMMEVMEGSAQKVDVSGWVKTTDLPNFWGKVNGKTLEDVAKQAQKWQPDDWTDVIDRATKIATNKYEERGLNLSAPAKNYWIAKAVITAMIPIVEFDGGEQYNALVNKFGEQTTAAALLSFGLHGREDDTTDEAVQGGAQSTTPTSTASTTSRRVVKPTTSATPTTSRGTAPLTSTTATGATQSTTPTTYRRVVQPTSTRKQ